MTAKVDRQGLFERLLDSVRHMRALRNPVDNIITVRQCIDANRALLAGDIERLYDEVKSGASPSGFAISEPLKETLDTLPELERETAARILASTERGTADVVRYHAESGTPLELLRELASLHFRHMLLTLVEDCYQTQAKADTIIQVRTAIEAQAQQLHLDIHAILKATKRGRKCPPITFLEEPLASKIVLLLRMRHTVVKKLVSGASSKTLDYIERSARKSANEAAFDDIVVSIATFIFRDELLTSLEDYLKAA